MKLPRDLGGADLAKALGRIGYIASRQTGSHIRLTHPGPPQHHVTIPAHSPLKLGTLAGILAEVAGHQGLSREQLLQRLFQT
ncbi:MAG: putative periplasmic or secreted lipoprotein [Nevskia sp.]|nr:putative periplasmic or secreted lipoprotein [Nevskia sp.]